MILLLLFLNPTAEALAPCYSAEVQRILDGDTFDARIELGFGIHADKRIRLYAVNAPETRTRNLVEKRHGLKVKSQLKAYIPEGSAVRFCSKGTGKYGRELGIVYKRGGKTSVNELVRRWSRK